MSYSRLFLVGAAAILLLVGAFILSGGRYVFVNAGGGHVLRGDRWTGAVEHFSRYGDNAPKFYRGELLDALAPVFYVGFALVVGGGAWYLVYRQHRRVSG